MTTSCRGGRRDTGQNASVIVDTHRQAKMIDSEVAVGIDFIVVCLWEGVRGLWREREEGRFLCSRHIYLTSSIVTNSQIIHHTLMY